MSDKIKAVDIVNKIDKTITSQFYSALENLPPDEAHSLITEYGRISSSLNTANTILIALHGGTKTVLSQLK